MLKSLWYLCKILLVVGLVVFLATQPGLITVTWQDYTFRDIHLGAAAVVLFLIVMAAVYVAGLLHRLFSLPREYGRYRAEKQRTRGYQALVRSLTAAATGDYKQSYQQARRAQKYLPQNEEGIPLLLQAHASKNQGSHDKTETAFAALLQNADTALLGIQGLMQKAMLQGDYVQALNLAKEVYAGQKKSYSLLRPIYDLEIRNRLWQDALATLDKAVSKQVIDKAEARRDKAAIFCLLGDQAKRDNRPEDAFKYYKKAVDAVPLFVPSVDRLARNWLERGQRLRALDLVKKTWIANPHPDLLPLWDMLVPTKGAEKERGMTRYRWFEWVQEFHPESSFAILAMAKVAIEEGLWGEAKAALGRAEKIEPSAQLYRLWVMLEERTTNRTDVIRQWLDRAAVMPPPPAWTCRKTGRHFNYWVAVVEPEGFFNTVAWGNQGVFQETPAEKSRWLLDRSAA